MELCEQKRGKQVFFVLLVLFIYFCFHFIPEDIKTKENSMLIKKTILRFFFSFFFFRSNPDITFAEEK